MTEPFVTKEIEEWTRTYPDRPAFTPTRLRQLRADVVAHGIAQGIGEQSADLAALAAPVFDASGKIALCVTLISTIGSLDTSYDGAPATALRRVTETLSRNLGAGALPVQRAEAVAD